MTASVSDTNTVSEAVKVEVANLPSTPNNDFAVYYGAQGIRE